MRLLVDRFIYQGLRYVPSRHAAVIKPYAGQLQDQDEKGSLMDADVRGCMRLEMRLCVGRDWAAPRARDVLAAVAARTSPTTRRTQLAGSIPAASI